MVEKQIINCLLNSFSKLDTLEKALVNATNPHLINTLELALKKLVLKLSD